MKNGFKRAFYAVLIVWCSVSFVKGQQYPQAILRGDYPDPSIIRDGKDYYMTHSPFVYAPGFLIWHSTDLVNWEPVCRAMPENVGSAMAPDLVKYKDRYYIYYPSNGTNWVIWADDIRGPWSKPVDLKVGRIDPGHVVDADGTRYLYVSDGWVVQLADDGLSVTGKPRKVYEGWKYPKSWVTEGMFLESPKLNYKDGYYYLTSAQGGTAGPATSHMAVAARSKSATGPWENSPYNPIVHTYSADEPWWSKGHGTLVDDVNGNWWIVYHAYEKGAYPLGRQTLIEPIEWTEDGWYRAATRPVALPGAEDFPARPIEISDSFDGNSLGWQWTSWKHYKPENIRFKKKSLFLKGKGTTPQDAEILLTTPMDLSYEIETELTVGNGNTGGLLLFYTNKAYAGITTDGKSFTLYIHAGQSVTVPNTIGKHLFLKIINRHYTCDFLASKNGKDWETLRSGVDVSEFHHNKYAGFFALRPALYSAGNGEARFNYFEYTPLPSSKNMEPVTSGTEEGVKAPKPVFRDPVYDGAADPVVIWNPEVKKWWMFYTNRRANQTQLPGVSWVHGTPIGIAESTDGANWSYLGTANFPDLPEEECGGKETTLWAPDVIQGDDGKFHMFLTIVPGVSTRWGLPGFIAHLTSTNLRDWHYESRLSQLGVHVLDADILKTDEGKWRLYYKDQTGYSNIAMIESEDLYVWSEKPEEVVKINGEGPITFKWNGYFWLIVDTWNGQTVFRSKDADTWERQPGSPLMPDEEGTGRDDTSKALHANVVLEGDRAYMYYFTHPGRIGDSKDMDSYEQRRTSIQVVELKMTLDGWLTADRNEPTYVKMNR